MSGAHVRAAAAGICRRLQSASAMAALTLPPPMKVNGRDYHDEADLDAADATARADILASA
jgi:hypothetical protein